MMVELMITGCEGDRQDGSGKTTPQYSGPVCVAQFC